MQIISFFNILLLGDIMLKNFFRFLKKIIFSILFLYSFNVVINPIGSIVPINLITILSISLLGLPALFSLVFLSFVIF